MDRTTQRWIFGFLALFLSLYIFLSVFSYFFHWKEDQAIVNLPFSESAKMEAANRGGPLGARIGEWLVADAFGVFGLLIPVVLIILSLRLLRFKPVMFNKLVSICLMTMIVGSVTLGYIGSFGKGPGTFGTGLGGAHGVFIAAWIESYLSYGTALLLLLLIVLLAVYINRSTISVINRMGQEVAEKTASLAGNVTEYIQQQREARLLVDEEKEEQEEVSDETLSEPARKHPEPVPETEEEEYETEVSIPAQGFFSRLFSRRAPDVPGREETQDRMPEKAPVDYDFNYRDDAVEPVAPMAPTVRRTTVAVEDDEDFIVRTAGEEESQRQAEREMPRIPLTDRRPEGKRYREVIDADGFVIRELVDEMDNTLDGLERADTEATARELYSEFDLLSAGGAAMGRNPEPGTNDASVQIEEGFTVRIAREEEAIPDDMIDTGFYDHTLDLSSYQKPLVELLENHHIPVSVSDAELRENKNKIKETLENFGIRIDKIEATVGPTVTLYEIIPAPGIRISKIKNLENDIALSLAALGIRIIAPIPGKGTIGIEVPNKNKQVVSMYSVIRSQKFQESDYDLPVALGRTIQNETYVIDLAKMPHLLVAGATGQGKSVGLNAIITSLLYKKHPSEVKFVMVDPKKVELTVYAKLEKHFLAMMSSESEPIITDTQKVVFTLKSLCIEMDSRYDLLKNAGVRNLKEYNAKFAARRLNPHKGHRYLPYIVVIIDEYADLLVTAGREVETPLARIAQLARAVGIHLVIATQRPTVDVITGLIKANIPARIAFRVTSMMNSRTILDHPGAEQLIGRGDMLVSTGGEITRVQCAFMDTPESERVMEFIGNQRGYSCAYELPEYVPEGEGGSVDSDALSKRDGLFEEVARLVVTEQQGSTSLIQRKFAIGFNRAGRIMDQLEAVGIVGRAQGSKPREVKITDLIHLDQMLAQMDQFH